MVECIISLRLYDINNNTFKLQAIPSGNPVSDPGWDGCMQVGGFGHYTIIYYPTNYKDKFYRYGYA